MLQDYYLMLKTAKNEIIWFRRIAHDLFWRSLRFWRNVNSADLYVDFEKQNLKSL